METQQKSRQEFLAARKKGIGGSDAPASVGMSKWTTRFQLWEDKTSEEFDDEETPYQRWGILLEPVIREEYSLRTGRDVRVPTEPFIHPKHTFAIANLDGISAKGGADERVYEGKTGNAFDMKEWGESGTDEVPVQYMMQCQHYMGVTGLPKSDLAVLLGGNDFRIYEIQSDANLQNLLFEQEAEFWKLVQDRIPPDPVTEEEAAQRWSRSLHKGMVEATYADVQTHEELWEVRAKIKELEERKKELQRVLKSSIKDNSGIVFAGKPLVTWKSTKDRSKFQMDKFKAENPELYEQYVESVPGPRMFLCKDPK